MILKPIRLMMERVETAGETDFELVHELLLAGELIVKTTTAALVASIKKERENYQYSLVHSLIRCDGIGDWARNLDQALTGPPSHHHRLPAEILAIFTRRVKKDHWQYKSVELLYEILNEITSKSEKCPPSVNLKMWFHKFAELRNKTRGHGALTHTKCTKIVKHLYSSIQNMIDHNPIFELPWAYLHQNLSGKYKVVEFGGDSNTFRDLKSTKRKTTHQYPDGVYIWIDFPCRVELIHSDADGSDFYVPNGSFKATTYELHSLITDNRQEGDASRYLKPAGSRPSSETEGTSELTLLGSVVTNLPPKPVNYVERPNLEAEVKEILTNDRHPIVTLVGRGGIGKTSLTLKLLHEIAHTDHYQVIVWFSARDIDLTTSGPKVVKPTVIADKDIAQEYLSLVSAIEKIESDKKNASEIMADHLRRSPNGPTLFIFDNFETVQNPVDLFHWIDMHIRLPNKAVITSRFREFKADYPIEISGMEQSEANKLIQRTADFLNIQDLLNNRQKEQVYEQSNGHPYVIKIMLGEIANTKRFGKPINLVASKDDILDALFERTYTNLSAAARRIFLTLSGKKAIVVPELALEAVFRKSCPDGDDPEIAIDELIRMSLVEEKKAKDSTRFLSVPRFTALFGDKKLKVHPHKELIENDIRFLRDIGVTSSLSKEGTGPKIHAFFKKIAKDITEKNVSFEEVKPVLEFCAQKYKNAWLFLADMVEEDTGKESLEKTADYITRFLETNPEVDDAKSAWKRLIQVYRKLGDPIAGCSAFLRVAELSEPTLFQISSMANWLNNNRNQVDQVTVKEPNVVFQPLADLFEKHIDNANSTDFSRLAWLHLHTGNHKRALELAKKGNFLDPDNDYCRKLVEKLSEQRGTSHIIANHYN